MTCWLALAAVTGYVLDAVGLGIQAWPSLAVALVATGAAAVLVPRQSRIDTASLIVWTGIVVFIAATLLRTAAPSFLPTGRGPDLTHHLLLVDYLEQHHHLVHDRALGGVMGEMAHYTPGSHLLAVMAGQWFGTDGLHTFFPLVAVCAALTAGFVFLIARRIGLLLPFAICASALLFLSDDYFFGAFTHSGFLSQTVSTLFAVAMWWALTAWNDEPTTAMAWVISIFLVATFLSWPIWIGPPLLIFLGLIRHDALPNYRRWRQLAIVIVPVLVIFVIHSFDRWGWMLIVRTSGGVLHPSLESLGWLLPVLAAIGVVCALPDRRARITLVMLFVIALQGLTLFVIAKAQGAETPYMALKMFYFAIYPMAVLAALAIARLIGSAAAAESIGWMVAAVLLAAVTRPALAAPRVVPVVSGDLARAGQWVRAHGGAACTDYLVGDAETAYWLHLAVLGNPRSSDRTREVERFDPRAAVAPWITAEGRAYGIADLRLLPDEVRSRVDVAAQFNTAAVIVPRGGKIKGCD